MEFKMKERGYETTFEYGTLDISGDAEFGFRPFQLLVSSVAVCSGGVLRKVLERMRLSYENIDVKAKVTRDEKEANKITDIHLHFIIIGNNLSEEKVKKALAVTRKNCSMVQSVIESINITESFEIQAQ
ncbi:OsmC family protein [Fictibacillus phosphorivorans]|uniref:OsmC family protein n=1 Tax=Fictibacillus phosphorivorans TaxID=1221500 RepID=UPI00203BDF53|nr:OsmC family protein [Fictibacillus phosphorivorans]MCM3720337.1 OsmC family protein [Fictibacillus phosphorivorans]MCM3778021.1 OsmC family protein [Fictibacillus phosphorivorans]